MPTDATALPPLPFSEPPHLSSLPSPIFTPSHLRFRAAIQPFISENLNQHALDWESSGHVPESVFAKFASANMLIPALPAPLPVEWLRRLGLGTLMGGVDVEEFDGLHGLVYGDEMARSGVLGPAASLTTGIAFGVPPIIKFGSRELQEQVLPDLLLGKKRACLAITEPGAGSDVANITTTAELSQDGKSYIVNGTKKWITNGLWADYATTAVRTGPPGPAGVSLLLIPLKDTPGITTQPILTTPSSSGTSTSGTSLITISSALVPATNLIGLPNHGLSYILRNFTHERISIAVGAVRQARVALGEAMGYVMRREAFGQALVEQPVVRHRLAKAGAMVESLGAWVEGLAWVAVRLQKQSQENAATSKHIEIKLGGMAALAKAHAGIVLDECARCAVLLFGGNGLTREGQGELVESN
ncbi:hypothetical protein FGG08_007495 [Glutinoglossum americanum]|uniref:Acyl-CoA dehydrogenase n=1 Tax=Glutinoglossum americanum TaxID=1670608 RepID=A0A9P8I569_9PEZI|nr:hypothetical protein FGG08_007495 [Glutinoglossum americanum]